MLTEAECIHFMRQICDGVKYMHQKNVLHLDLKPENILCITKNSNEVKIIDFGLARKFDPNTETKVRTKFIFRLCMHSAQIFGSGKMKTLYVI